MTVTRVTGSQSPFDVNAAVRRLDANAGSSSTGRCAQYVREALEAGGLDTSGHPATAGGYDVFLERKGFERLDPTAVANPQRGDVVVLQDPEGGAGHIDMYDGSRWVSDFVQRDFWAGPRYRGVAVYSVFRP